MQNLDISCASIDNLLIDRESWKVGLRSRINIAYGIDDALCVVDCKIINLDEWSVPYVVVLQSGVHIVSEYLYEPVITWEQ